MAFINTAFYYARASSAGETVIVLTA